MKRILSCASLVLTAICLFGCVSAIKTPLPLAPAPWLYGEMMRLKVSTPQADEIGIVFYSVQRDTKDGHPDLAGWLVISHNYISASDSGQYTQVNTAPESFRPLFSRTVNLLGDFTAEYGGKKVKLYSTGAAGEIKKDVDVNSTVYDNEQLIYLLRRLPLEDGFKASFELFAIASGTVVDCAISVAGREKITVPAGTFDCCKVILSMRAGQEKPMEQVLWFSADRHRYLVKYAAGTILQLAEVSRIEKDAPLTFEDDQLGFSVAVPSDWRFYKHASGPAFFIEMLSPRLKAKAVLCVLPAGDGVNPMEVTRQEVEIFKRFFKGYTVRNDNFKEVSVGPLKAVQYIADFTEEANAVRRYAQPREVVEYRTYIVGKDKVYFFVFRADKDKFDSLESEFDAIIQSFELK